MAAIAGFIVRDKLYESHSTVVYRAVRTADSRKVVLKMLKDDFPLPEDIIRFKREFEITSQWQHERLIRSDELLYVRNKPVIVMEDIGGESLGRLVSTRDWSIAELLSIASKIAEGLAAVHANHIVHKDINPANIVYAPATSQLKIIDFGISSAFSREAPLIRNPDALEGTLAYISPEQTGRMNCALDFRSDFYSFGVLLYELFTGAQPFSSADALGMVHQHLTQTARAADEVQPTLPHPIAAIIAKLMAKSAAERYHSGWGIKADLDRCLDALNTHGQIPPFELGESDTPDQFQLPQKRYGRECAVHELFTSFEQVSHGSRELVLIAGYSGIGKTCLVHELYKPATQRRGYLIGGKFDQMQRNSPYSAVVAAFQELVRQLLTESEDQLHYWRERLSDALGKNGQIIVDAIPEMGRIMGPQTPVEDLPPREARNRFNVVFQRFIQVFCRPAHPLVMFLDDLQWADNATLTLIESLMTDESTHHLLVILAYRDNEISVDHPFISRLDKLAGGGMPIRQILLKPLGHMHVEAYVADTLHCEPAQASQLAQLVELKTGGNPFFVGQFLTMLYQKGFIWFGVTDAEPRPRWHWDIGQIQEADFTDNVIELLVEKLTRLPAATQTCLCVAACMGNVFSLAALASVREASVADTHTALLPALREGFILPATALQLSDPSKADSVMVYGQLKFLHDRVQQAAYAMIPDAERAAMHLHIGRLLLANATLGNRQDRVFELVDHLNVGRELMAGPAERLSLARLNLEAALKAKAGAAFAAAHRYVVEGFLAGGGDWHVDYDLALQLHRAGAVLQYLNGDYAESERLIESIWQQGKTPEHKALAYDQLVTQHTMLGRYEEAIAVSARALRLFGVDLPDQTQVDVELQKELVTIESGLQGRTVMSLLDLPEMTDATTITVMKLLTTVHTTIYFAGHYTHYCWVLARMTSLSMRYGNIPESAKGYASFGNTLAANLGRFETGYEFGMLGVRLAEHYGNQSLRCKTNLIMSMFLNHWSRPMLAADVFDDEGEQAGLESGEFQFVGYILFYGRTLNRFYRGDYLGGLLSNLKTYLRFARKAKHSLSTDNLIGAGRVLTALIGNGVDEEWGTDGGEDELHFLASCQENRSQSALAFFHTAQAFRRYLERDLEEARRALDEAHRHLAFVRGTVIEAAYVFYESLILASSASQQDAPVELLDRIHANQQRMANWAAHAPANFRHQYLLIEAEMARLTGRDLDAMDRYDEAIEAASEAGFKQNEALAHELAGRFWLGRRKQEFALCHLRCARQGYRAWGCHSKDASLLAEFPQLGQLRADGRAATLSETTTMLSQHLPPFPEHSMRLSANNLDLASVLKASQAISGEIELDSLLDRLLRVLLESAGAEYGCVLLQRDGKMMVAASISMVVGGVTRRSNLPLEESDEVPHSVVQYVQRLEDSVLCADALSEALFAADPYVQQHGCRSILCLPIRHGGELTGVLYLENNQMVGAFPPSRMGLLGLLASQAAISIQNALLYTDLVAEVAQHKRAEAELSEAEAQYRAVFENAADGIFRANAEGRLTLANPALAKMLGFPSPGSLLEYSGMLGAERFLSDDMRAMLIQHFNREGSIRNVEFRASRRDGSVLELSITGFIGRAPHGEVLYFEGVIQDVTARKRVIELKIAKEAAEAAAHAKGEFLANMSHEIRTPMTAILGFATLALKQDVPPRVKDYLQKIDMAGQSLLGIINDILDFSKMDAGRLALEEIPFSLAQVVNRVRDLFADQARDKGVTLNVSVESKLPATLVGDPSRLGQILVNLVSNAVKFTKQGEVALEVTIQSRRDDVVTLCFEVRDTGIGMAQSQIDRLFQAFAQADTSTTRHYGGTGLGLTISKNLTELMGGGITVASEQGVGTIFVVTVAFPIAKAELAPPVFIASPPTSGESLAGKDVQLLLVEDNAINQQVAIELLVSAGYQVDVAENGVEAVRKAELRPYTAILMDIQMPEMDGYEATRRIRQGRLQPHIPIIAMTAHAIAGYREQCLARGMNDYVTKPISPPELYRTLARWCKSTGGASGAVAGLLADTDLSEFHGLAPLVNVSEVWRHVGGKRDLLYRLLERFVQSGQGNDDILRAAMQDADLETAQRIVHTTKGMAGTLAADELRSKAANLEMLLERGDLSSSNAAQLDYFLTAERLREHIAHFLAQRTVEVELIKPVTP